MQRAMLVVTMILWVVPGAEAQTARSFEELRRLAPVGETVYLVDAAGAERKARIFDISGSSLELTIDGARLVLRPADVTRVERRRKDSVWNGVLMGAGAGALIGFAGGRRLDSPSCPGAGPECGQGAIIGATGGALWGALGGWVVDALVRKREVVYAAPGATPY